MTNETMNKEANEQHEAGVMAAPCPKNVELWPLLATWNVCTQP